MIKRSSWMQNIIKLSILIFLMQSIKEKVIQIINNLPKEADYEDIMEAIYVQQKIEKGIKELDNGEFITHEEMKARLTKWLQ